MQKLFQTLSFCAVIVITFDAQAQNILIADNNVGAVAVTGKVFVGDNALQDAIDAAVDDDIIQVIRSSINYGAVISDKRLNIFGIGIRPDTEGGSKSNVTQIDLVAPGASGSRVSGLTMTTGIFLDGAGTLNNVIIDNNWVRRVQHVSNTTILTNLIIRNCIMGSNIGATMEETIDFILGFVSNAVIANNLIYGSTRSDCCNAQEGAVTADQTTFENNVFVNDNSSIDRFAFEDLRNSTLKNNIFYGTGPQARSVLSNNTFENNMSYHTSSGTQGFVTSSGNTSINNVTGVDPAFVGLGFGSSTGSLTTLDPTPTATEALGTGTDGTDLGVFGGPIPFKIEGTLIPTIQVLDVPSMVIEGNTLDVHIEAKGN